MIHAIMKKITAKIRKKYTCYLELQPINISECMYADDLEIFAHEEEHVQYNLNRWTEELKAFGMKINIENTKIMVVPRKKK